MTLPRKYTRPITVDGTQYRWMLKETDYGAWFELLLVVEAVECPNGEQLGAHLEAEDRREDDAVTPGIVESLTRAARAEGWLPTLHGSCPALSGTLRRLLAERRA